MCSAIAEHKGPSDNGITFDGTSGFMYKTIPENREILKEVNSYEKL